MSARLTTHLFITALRKKAEAAGGTVTVLVRGDQNAGGLLMICAEKGQCVAILELSYDLSNAPNWQISGPQNIEKQQQIDDYLVRRRVQDRDLWQIELDIPDAERFAADFVSGD